MRSTFFPRAGYDVAYPKMMPPFIDRRFSRTASLYLGSLAYQHVSEARHVTMDLMASTVVVDVAPAAADRRREGREWSWEGGRRERGAARATTGRWTGQVAGGG
jgi:hypothetical protein